MSEENKDDIRWFGHAPSLDRASRSLHFHGEVGRGEEARTINVAVRWEALEALEGQQSEVRDRARYSAIFEEHRGRFEAIAAKLHRRDTPLQDGYLVIGPEHLGGGF
ncbi:DUF1488 family protein [Aquibaculum sediminis]|uniref:DUF1488 family protein n=1 Tax=Aquibaculum sediminis TaxID=3231907 RepID=UPI0034533A3E